MTVRREAPSPEELQVALRQPSYFVSLTSSVTDVVDLINKTSKCGTDSCKGILVPSSVEVMGLGGALRCRLKCTGCALRTMEFNSSTEVPGSRRTQVTLAVEVATVLAGGGFAMYDRLFGQGLGLHTVSESNFSNNIFSFFLFFFFFFFLFLFFFFLFSFLFFFFVLLIFKLFLFIFFFVSFFLF